MFTGIIQSTGSIHALSKQANERRLVIEPHNKEAFLHIVEGESIAVNGCCLSVEDHSETRFSLYASEETCCRSTLGSLEKGSLLNLERALLPGDRLGGHIVTGHVDCIATVSSLSHKGESLCVTLLYPESYASQLVAKGSVTLDGISLTLNSVQKTSFSVNIIPDTQKRTTVRLWKKGSKVNMETDILGKYVERILSLSSCKTTEQGSRTKEGNITKEFLALHGFS